MRICVYGPDRDGQERPQVLYLGARRLPVVAVLRCWQDAGERCYEVSVDDGRHFVLRHAPLTGLWQLAAVYSSRP